MIVSNPCTDMKAKVTSIKGAKAAFSSPACSLWPYKFVSQLLARLAERGALNLQTNTPVLKVVADGDIDASAVHTTRGSIKAKKVVFATKAYTGGIAPASKDKIVPILATVTHLATSRPVYPHLSHTYNITYAQSHVDHLNPRPDGSIVVGGGKWMYTDDREV